MRAGHLLGQRTSTLQQARRSLLKCLYFTTCSIRQSRELVRTLFSQTIFAYLTHMFRRGDFAEHSSLCVTSKLN